MITELISYILLFGGIIVVGEAALIPAIFLGLHGNISLFFILVLYLLAVFISDSIWYWMGRSLMNTRIARWRIVEYVVAREHVVKKTFNNNPLLILFLSKFMIGTRAAVQTYSGTQRIAFLSFFAVIMTSSILWFGILTAILAFVAKSLSAFAGSVYYIQLSVFAILLVLVLFFFAARMFTKKILPKKNPAE